jgi:stearoyl-CoA desaturase (delta-9 desaturase)
MATDTLSRDRIHWTRSVPFLLFHAVALVSPFFVPFAWKWVALAVAMYFLRMFFVTAAYHRYFSHRTYKTSRPFQFLLALMGGTCAQKGALWWAAHHRNHHRYSDQPEDIHSPVQRGLFWSHVGWILAERYEETEYDQIKDFARYPELVWLNKHHLVPPVALAVVLVLIGGWPALVWGFFVSTVLLWHGTFTINSLAHLFGRRRYQTTDDSRNSMVLALITMGEGWHNNHHYYQSTANQGWFWWEIDLSYYVLRALQAVRLIWDVRTPPPRIRDAHLRPAPAGGIAAPWQTQPAWALTSAEGTIREPVASPVRR